MATKTYYVSQNLDNNFCALVDGTAQTAASRTDGWTVAKIGSALASDYDAATKQASGTFTTATSHPPVLVTGTNANAFKTPAALSGIFDVGSWVFAMAVRATTASSQAGRIRMRVFASVNADGSSARELTSATVVGTTTGALSTTADVTSTATWSPGTTIQLNNEYLFFVIAWEITTASGNNSGDAVIRTGSTGPAGTYVTTPNVTLNTLVSGTDGNTGSANETAIVEVSDFPQNGVIDNFNRADGILTSPWVGMTIPTQTYLTPYVSSNQASTGPPGNGCGAYRSDQSLTDCEAYVDLPNPSEAQYHDVWLRFTPGTDIGSQNGYYLRHDSTNNKLMLQKVSSGASGTVGSQPTCVASPGDSIGARVIGTTFSIYYKPLGAAKWRVLGTGVDATYQGAAATGFFSPAHPAIFDNFGGGSVTTAKAGTDNNGTTTESGSITQVQIPVTDSNVTVESATVTKALISSSDSNAVSVESASILPMAGLIVRLDASQLGLADGAAVSPWPNLASPGIPGTMTGSPGPTYRVNGLNGQGVVRFSAGGGRMRMTSTGVSSPFTLIAVARDWSVNAGAQRVITTVYPPNNFLLGWWGGYQDTVFDGGWASGEPSVRATPIWKLYSFDKTGANPVRMFSNGAAIRNGGSGSADLGGSLNISGHQADTAESSDCEVAEIFLYNRVLSDAERQQVEGYLRTKWFPAPQNYPQTIQADAPIGYWRLGEPSGTTGADSSGMNHPVTINGGPVMGVAGPLADGSLALQLDGVDDYATIPSGVTLPANSSVTVEWWQYVATADVKAAYGFFMYGGVETTARLSAHTPWSDKILYWDCGNIATQRPTTDYTPYLDKWTLVQLTYDAVTNKHAISFNGTEVASNTTADVGTAVFAGGAIGGGTNPPTSFVKARYAEFALYNYALSPAQRLAHFNVGMSKVASVTDNNGATTESQSLVITSSDSNGATTEAVGPINSQIVVYEPDAVGTNDQLSQTLSSYSAITGQYATYQALSQAQNPLPVLVETATISQYYSGTDSNGTTTEAASVKALASDTDSGAGSDSASLVAKITATDTSNTATDSASLALAATDVNGTTTENASYAVQVVQVPASDTNGATTETPVLVAKFTDTDSGVGFGESTVVGAGAALVQQDFDAGITETAAITGTQVPVSDSGTVSEITNIRQTTADSNGTTTEAAAPQGVLASADSGVISEATAIAIRAEPADSNLTTTENTSIRTSVADTNGTVSEITSLAQAATDAATANEATILKVVLADTDANGLAIESGSTAQINSIFGTDANGLVTETAAFTAVYVASDSGTISEITSMALGVADSNATTTEIATTNVPVPASDANGTVTESVTLKIAPAAVDTGSAVEVVGLVAKLADVDSNVTTEIQVLGYFPLVTDAATASESAAITRIQLSAADSGTGTEGIGTRTLGATDANGVVGEISSLNTPVTATDVAQGSESASVSVPGLIGSDAGSGADSAVAGVLLAPSDTISTSEASSVVVKLSSADQTTIITEIGVITYSAVLSDSGTSSETPRIGITVTDTLFEIGEADADLVDRNFDTDSNGVTLEVVSIYVTGSRPIGKIPSITAIDGVDTTSITAAGPSTTTLTDVNSPDSGILVDTSVESGVLIAVNAVDRG